VQNPKKDSKSRRTSQIKKRKLPTEKKVMTWSKNNTTSFAVGDPMEHLHNVLLEVLGKVEELTDVIFHLWHFVDHIIKTWKAPSIDLNEQHKEG